MSGEKRGRQAVAVLPATAAQVLVDARATHICFTLSTDCGGPIGSCYRGGTPLEPGTITQTAIAWPPPPACEPHRTGPSASRVARGQCTTKRGQAVARQRSERDGDQAQYGRRLHLNSDTAQHGVMWGIVLLYRRQHDRFRKQQSS